MKRGAYKAKIEKELPCREVVIAAYANRLESQSARIVSRRIVDRWTWQEIAAAETLAHPYIPFVRSAKVFAIYDVQKLFRAAIADLVKYLEAKGTIQYAERKPESEQLELVA